LGGKTIALYHNDKVASFPVMRSIRKQLEPYEIKEVFEIHAGTPFSRHPDEAIEETSRADAVFVGTADWGSCTAWVVDAAVRIEKSGKPTILVAAAPFREEIASHSRMDGLPYLPFVVVDYAQEVLPLIPPAVEKAFDKMVKVLTTPVEELEKKIPGEMV
jgi:hypothetical protein